MAHSEYASRPPVAVVGVSALFPGSLDATGFWADILAGTDRMDDVPPSHWLIEDHFDADPSVPDKTYGRRGGFLDEVDLDVMGFGIPPFAVPSTDTAQLLALIVAQQVLDDATRGQFSELDRSRASVILGVTSGQELLGAMASRMNRPMWLQGMRRAGIPEDVATAACDRIADLHPEWTESTFPGLLGNVVAGRIANRLDLGGTNCVTDAACASSFSALSMGVNELYLGDSDLVIAGGVDTMNDIFMYMCFSKTPALSRTEDIRPFSDQADGTMLGEGIGMVALKRLADAERDGNHVYCVVNGVGASSDGRSKSVYAPVSAGQARALTNAYDKAGYGPDSVELVEAHGTGTVAGDAAEFGGLELAFRSTGRTDDQWCALGSVKSQIGHTKAAAGAAGLIKVIMGLHHKVLPLTAKIDQPNPELDLENSPFHLNTVTRPWVRGSDHERRGSVSSFGFGGSNFHVALSEYTGDGVRAPRLRTSDAELVVLTGADGADIIAQAREHAEAASAAGYLQWLARSSQLAYAANAPSAVVRLALVATDEDDLTTKLGEAIDLIERDPTSPFSTPSQMHFGVGAHNGDVAFLFPGQGSQYPFMGADLATNFTNAIGAWDVAADLDWSHERLHDVVYPIPSFAAGGDDAQAALLTATQWAQPAIGATSLSMLRVLRSVGVDARHVGGHSFGEITALHAAGVLTETDMLRVARRRGELMAEAAQTPGSMTAVARTIEEVRSLVEASGVDVVIANHNSQTQVVLSGTTEAIEQMEARLSEEGITAKRLPVATAFHSPVVSGASGAFAEFLDTVEFAAPEVPVHGNETASPYPSDVATMRAQLGRQLANPVRFVEMVQAMHDAGARTFVEVGPSSILTGLAKKILKGREHRAITLDKKNKTGLGAFLDGLGQLAAAGVPMDFAALWSEYSETTNPHDIEPPKLAIPINGANYGKPYPPLDATELVAPNPSPPTPTIDLTTETPMSIAPAQPESPPQPAAPSAPPAPSANGQAPAVPVAATQPVPAVAPVVPVAQTSGVLAAYQAMQQQTAAAHAEYLRSMAQVHTAFLATAHQGMTTLAHLAGAPAAPAMPAIAAAPAMPLAPVAMPVVPAPVQPVYAAPPAVVAVPAPVAPAPAPAAPAPVAAAPAPPPVVAAAAPAPVAPPTAPVETDTGAAAALSVDDLTTVLLGVVSEKTGYPSEMLSMGMELEGDLGIDSIKRVEILSAMQDEVPGLPEVDMAVMSELVTLGQVVEYMAGEVAGGDAVPFGSNPRGTGSPRAATASPTHATATTTPALGRFVVRTVEAPATGHPLTGLTTGRLAVTNDGTGVAPALVERLTSRGVAAEVVAGPQTGIHSGVIVLDGLAEMTTIDQAATANRRAFEAARALALATSGEGVLVTVSDLGGRFGFDASNDSLAPWSGGMSGLTRTAAIEWPQASLRAIDIERGGRAPHAIAAALADELLGGGIETEVGLTADGTRCTLRSEPVEVTTGVLDVAADDVLIVSGGARGVTAAMMIELARASGATFVLLGRTELADEPAEWSAATDDVALKRLLLDVAKASGEAITPNELSRRVGEILGTREIRATLAAIAAVGGRARYVPVDVTDPAAVAEVAAAARADFGPITGIVHGAGVLADKRIAEKTDEQFDRVFTTKVGGLAALLAAVESDPLKLLVMFSSVAARTGNNGQADYAMANEVLNKVALAERRRRGPACVVKSLGWGPWEGGMVSPALKAHFEAMGVTLIPVDEGARMLVSELASGQTDEVDVVLGGGVLPSQASTTPVGAGAGE